MLNPQWWAIPPSGDPVILPDVGDWSIQRVSGTRGAIEFEYPVGGAGYSTLVSTISTDRDIEIEIRLGNPSNTVLRGFVMGSSRDSVSEGGYHKFVGHFLEQRAYEAVLFNNASDEKGETRFSAANAGQIAAYLMGVAQARGALSDLTYSTFSASTDSNGQAWPTVTSLTLSPGKTYGEILESLEELGLCEWEVTDSRELRLYVWGTRGTDRTVGASPLVLQGGRDIREAPRTHTVEDAVTALLVSGKDGLYQSESDAAALARRGRRIEAYQSAGDIEDAGALTAFAQVKLANMSSGVQEVTHELVVGGDGPLVFEDVTEGDWVYSDTSGVVERLRVQQIDLARNDDELTASVVVGTLTTDYLTRLAKRLQALESGSAVVGTSEPPGERDTLAPAAPTGLVATSEVYTDQLGALYAAVYADWTPVTLNSDGSVASDISGYQVRWRHINTPGLPTVWFTLPAVPGPPGRSWSGLPTGVGVEFQVSCYDFNNNFSAWSAGYEFNTAEDITPPPAASAPVVSESLSVLKVYWDGLGPSGEPMPVDFLWAEVHVSTTSNFTPDDTTLFDYLSGRGTSVFTGGQYGVTYFFKLVTVDRIGNKAVPSAQGASIPEQVVSSDLIDSIITAPKIADFAVGTAKIVDAAIVNAKIADLAVNDAKIASLAAGKITAGTISAAVVIGDRFTTALTGQRVQLGFDGLKQFDGLGNLRVAIEPNGNALLTGMVQSAMTGARFIINPGGSAPDEIRLYPSSGVNYGTIKTVTSQSVDFGPQSGISMKAHSGRADTFAGRFEAFPDYASMGWGETILQAVPQQVNIGGPRIHFSAYRNSNYTSGSSEIMRFGIVDRNNPGAYVDATVLVYQCSSANEPSFRAPWWNSALAFGNTFTGSINNASTSYIPHRASAFQVFTSARATKRDITDLDYEGGPLAALRKAPVKKWRRIAEVEELGDAADVHIGPMADDLPPEVVRHDTMTGNIGYEIDALVGLVHGAVAQLADQVDKLSARIAALESRTPPR